MNKIKIVLALFICSLFLPALVVAADSFPVFPMSFFGTATLNGTSMPVGSKIQVYTGLTLLDEVTVSEAGIYGYDDPLRIKLVVGDYTGNLTFKYVLGGSTPKVGCLVQKYFDNFVTSTSVSKNLAFDSISCEAPSTPIIQTAPNASGIATSSSSATQVVITHPTQPVTITVSSGTTNPTIDVNSFIGINGSGTLPAINIVSVNANNITVAIPASTVVTSASTTWNGIIAAPTVTSVSLPVTSGQTKTLSTAIEVGFAGAKLSFDKAVKILLPGQAGKRVGYIRTGISFTDITNSCSSDSQSVGDALIPDGECKIDVGSDLVIWTKHFTSFATYTQATTPVPTPVSSGGGGGGGSATTYCSDVTYSAWQSCTGNQQFRTVLTSTPASCTLTTPQQLETNRICQIATSTEPVINITTPIVSTSSTIITQDSNTQTARVMADEKKLTIKVDSSLIKRLAGRILLQTEQFGQAWYLDSVSLSRYYLADGPSAYNALRKFGLGIKNVDLNKIPVGQESRFSMVDTDQDGLPDKLEEGLGTNPLIVDTDGDKVSDGIEVLKNNTNPLGTDKLIYSTSLINRLKGRIVIQTESRGEAWYINPIDGKRYYLANGEAAYQIMRYLSLGISNINIHKITVGSWE